MKTLFLAETGVKLKNLTGYTAYMVSVAAFNAAGEGPRSSPTPGQTQQAGGGTRWREGGVSPGGDEGPPGPGLWALVGSRGSHLLDIWAGSPGPWGALRSREHSPQRGANV